VLWRRWWRRKGWGLMGKLTHWKNSESTLEMPWMRPGFAPRKKERQPSGMRRRNTIGKVMLTIIMVTLRLLQEKLVVAVERSKFIRGFKRNRKEGLIKVQNGIIEN